MAKEKNLLIGGLVWFDINYPQFLKSAKKFRQNINKPKYPIRKETISSRVLNHWHNKGILDDNRINKTGWRKLNTIEILWINIIKKLRVFGFDLDRIRLVKKNLESFNLSKKKGEFAVLDFYLGYSIVYKKPVKLLVFSNGDTIIGRQVDIDLSNHFLEEDYISIDIPKLVNKLKIGPEIETDYINYSSSNIEKEITKGIYLENLKSIKIKVNDEDILLEKEHIKYSRDEIKSLINKIGDYYEETTVKKGKKKFYKILEMKKTKE